MKNRMRKTKRPIKRPTKRSTKQLKRKTAKRGGGIHEYLKRTFFSPKPTTPTIPQTKPVEEIAKERVRNDGKKRTHDEEKIAVEKEIRVILQQNNNASTDKEENEFEVGEPVHLDK